ncbi:50S ribosomal protein L25 [bacterium SCSIO 12741]|nr:50S ribosomal protein L25 [bacterium SCSIO 12741]
MKSISMSGSARNATGSKSAKELRKEGMVPCVVYGANEPIHFAIDARQFKNLVYTPNVYVVNMTIDDQKLDVFLKDIQFHPVTDEVIHADFFCPKEGQEVTLSLPVQLEGTAPGVLNGGKLRLNRRKVSVQGKVENMPDYITIDISKMRINQGKRVSELAVDGLTFKDPADSYVVFIKTARGAVDTGDDEEEGAEAAAPAEGAEA